MKLCVYNGSYYGWLTILLPNSAPAEKTINSINSYIFRDVEYPSVKMGATAVIYHLSCIVSYLMLDGVWSNHYLLL